MAEVCQDPAGTGTRDGGAVLVIGGDGFVGRATCQLLSAEGWAVHLTQRTTRQDVAPFVRHDWDGGYEGLVGIIEKVRPSVILFLASSFRSDHAPADIPDLVDSNIRLGCIVAEAALHCGGIGIVNAGTVWQYGIDAQDPVPVNLYAVTKQNLEDMLHWYHRVRRLSCVTLLLSDTYGPADTRRKILPLLVGAIAREDEMEMSAGAQVIEFVHAEDVARGFLLACRLSAGAPEPLWRRYILPGERIDLRGLAEKIAALLQRTPRLRWGARPYRAREVMVPVETGLESLPGWIPLIPLDEGLAPLCRSAQEFHD